jgi:hypothetical protein
MEEATRMKKVLIAFLSETVWRLLLAYAPSRHGLRLPAQIRARLRTAAEAQELSRPWLTSRVILLEDTEDDGLMKWLESVERMRDAPKEAIGEAKRAVTDARRVGVQSC